MSNNINNVTFNEREHTYWYEGRQMYGVTGAIGAMLGKKFPEGVASVDAVRSYGSQVHKEIENWIKGGCWRVDSKDMSCGAKWVADYFLARGRMPPLASEVRVSDFVATASNVDIVEHCPAHTHAVGKPAVVLYDIKTGEFDRQYCSLQLNAYRVMYEKSYGAMVLDMRVLCVKDRRVYRIYDYDGMDSRIDLLFLHNRRKTEGK